MSDTIEFHDQPKYDKVYQFDREPKQTHIDLFERLASNPDSTVPLRDALLILCTPRCGSTLFCEALNSTGTMGIAEEWFNYEYFASWERVVQQPFKLRDYILWVVRKSTRNTGILCLKWHIGQLTSMHEDFDLGIESMDFRHVVYLYRRDKIAQTASLVRAISSDQFRCYEEQKREPVFTLEGMAEGLHSITKFDQFARRYLSKYWNAEYAYEDFKQHRKEVTVTRTIHPHKSYNEVLKAMGVPECDDFPVERLKRQKDKRNSKASRDFLKYITGETE